MNWRNKWTKPNIHSLSRSSEQKLQEANFRELKSYATAIKQHSAWNFNNFIGLPADRSRISIINEIINHHRMTSCSTTTMIINNITITNTINRQLNYFFLDNGSSNHQTTTITTTTDYNDHPFCDKVFVIINQIY